MSTERIQTRRSARRQPVSSSDQPERNGSIKVDEFPPTLEPTSAFSPRSQPQQSASRQYELNVEEIETSTQNKQAPPILEAEQTILVDGSSSTFIISPPFNEEEIRMEISQKEPPNVNRPLQNAVKIPFVYYSIREYVIRKKGTVDGLVHLIREHEKQYNVTRRTVEQHIERNTEYYGAVDQVEVANRMQCEKDNVPASINVVKPEAMAEAKTVEDENVERRIMRLLENTDTSEAQLDDDELTFYNPESGTNENMNGAIIMTNEELQYYQTLHEASLQVLDDFNFRRIEKYDDFVLAFRKVTNTGEEPQEVTLLQILQYRRFENPPPAPETLRDLEKEEVAEFLGTFDEDFCYYLDLFTHRHIYGVATIGLLIEAKTQIALTEQSVRRIINARRKERPPVAPNYDLGVTTGYLSHDYWPSLLCVPEGEHHVRFFNLTNTRSDGFLRYYRCSKCCTIKVSASRDIKTRKYQDIPADFQVPKLQIRGDQVVTNWSELDHYPECHPTAMPNMLAEQLDRRARRQASLGLMAPREAWTEAYFEALRISEAVKSTHSEFPSVAELFPSYDTCRGQYSRSFHKYKRVLSMPSELQRVVHKRKLVTSANSIYDEDSLQDELLAGKSIAKRTRGLRRGREADDLFQLHVPTGYKREMLPGYIPLDESNNMEYFYVDEIEGQELYDEDSRVEVVDHDQIEEVVITADVAIEDQPSTSGQHITQRKSPRKDEKNDHISVV